MKTEDKVCPQQEGNNPQCGQEQGGCDCDEKSCGCNSHESELPESEPIAATLTPAEEILKWRDVAMRTAAEYDNYRKRSVKDRESFTRYANCSLIEELLPVVDNFEMGMQMAQQDTQSMIYIGMNMVQKQLHDFLDSQGVISINAKVGEAFDHNKHEAIQSEQSDLPEGSIVRVIRKGYKLKDRLLRPVNVVTASAKTTDEV